jgi:hypothetical protein
VGEREGGREGEGWREVGEGEGQRVRKRERERERRTFAISLRILSPSTANISSPTYTEV